MTVITLMSAAATACGLVIYLHNQSMLWCCLLSEWCPSSWVGHTMILPVAVLFGLIPGWPPLRRKCRQFDKIFVTGCTGSCHFDNSSAASDENPVQPVMKIKIINFLFQCHDWTVILWSTFVSSFNLDIIVIAFMCCCSNNTFSSSHTTILHTNCCDWLANHKADFELKINVSPHSWTMECIFCVLDIKDLKNITGSHCIAYLSYLMFETQFAVL